MQLQEAFMVRLEGLVVRMSSWQRAWQTRRARPLRSFDPSAGPKAKDPGGSGTAHQEADRGAQCAALPYRSWCPHCVRGKAVTSPHPRGGDKTEDPVEESGITTVSLDYCFVSGVDEDEGTAGDGPVLIIVDGKSGAMHALPTEKKGSVPWVVKWVVNR